MIYTVSEIAKILNIAPSTIRYYDKEGLLPAVERSRGGIRIFTERDLGWLRMISCLKSTGMPIKEIRRYAESARKGDDTLEERLQMIYRQRERLLAQMKELEQTLAVVDYKCWYYETALAAGSEEAAAHMPPEKIPEKYHAVLARLHEAPQ